jgi:hypothetical protein
MLNRKKLKISLKNIQNSLTIQLSFTFPSKFLKKLKIMMRKSLMKQKLQKQKLKMKKRAQKKKKKQRQSQKQFGTGT